MPRGTRAIFGTEASMVPHGRGNTHQELWANIPETGWLPVNCWCEMHIVAVTQRDLTGNGVTYSCGESHCNPPEGVVYQAAVIRWDLNFNRINSGVLLRRMRGETRDVRVMRRPKKVVRARERIDERRDLIQSMYTQGKQEKFIADALGMDYIDVQVELAYMRLKNWMQIPHPAGG